MSEKSSDGVHFTTLTPIKANNKGSRYTVTDNQPFLEDVNYYRIKSIDLSGKTELTNIKAVKIDNKANQIAVFPTVLQKGDPLSIWNIPIPSGNGLNGRFEVYLFDNQGRNVGHQTLINRSNQWALPNLSNGVYFYSIRSSKNEVVKTGKLMVL
jgi:hypothetical protein